MRRSPLSRYALYAPLSIASTSIASFATAAILFRFLTKNLNHRFHPKCKKLHIVQLSFIHPK